MCATAALHSVHLVHPLGRSIINAKDDEPWNHGSCKTRRVPQAVSTFNCQVAAFGHWLLNGSALVARNDTDLDDGGRLRLGDADPRARLGCG